MSALLTILNKCLLVPPPPPPIFILLLLAILTSTCCSTPTVSIHQKQAHKLTQTHMHTTIALPSYLHVNVRERVLRVVLRCSGIGVVQLNLPHVPRPEPCKRTRHHRVRNGSTHQHPIHPNLEPVCTCLNRKIQAPPAITILLPAITAPSTSSFCSSVKHTQPTVYRDTSDGATVTANPDLVVEERCASVEPTLEYRCEPWLHLHVVHHCFTVRRHERYPDCAWSTVPSGGVMGG